ncbi:MAG: hypothetical protein ACI4R9_07675 [Kiritimatiellia bacterium]
MRAFGQIFRLEFLGFVRSRALPLLSLAALAWTQFLPFLVRGDGTAAGEYQIYCHYALGGAALLLTVTLAASAAGSLAKDRAAGRLSLTAVRPVPYAVIVLGRAVALTTVGAVVMALAVVSALICLARYPRTFEGTDGGAVPMDFSLSRPCYHVLSPIMEKTAREEAEEAYEKYRTDPATSNNVAEVDRKVALDILTQRAEERFDQVGAGQSAEWKFAAVPADAVRLAVRMKFANSLETRGEFHGRFRLGDCVAEIGNATEAVLMAPLVRPEGGSFAGALRFDNTGREGVMLRPRKDLHLLYGRPGDVFAANLLYAYLATVAMLALVVSFALFLSACLSRSVAVFTVIVLLLAAEIAPSIMDECMEGQVASLGDRIGMRITNFVAQATKSIGSVHPLETLANDECLEPAAVARTLASDLILMPLVLSVLAGLVIPRKSA